MNFAPFNAHTTPLFKDCNVLKFADIINVESCIFISNCFNRDSFSIFNENFKLVSTTHSYNTRSARNGLLFVITQSDLGENQLSTLTWQCLQDNFLIFKDKYQNLIFKDKYNFLCLTPKSLKMLLLKFFISEYNS